VFNQKYLSPGNFFHSPAVSYLGTHDKGVAHAKRKMRRQEYEDTNCHRNDASCTPQKEGEFDFFCDILRSKREGMDGKITVTV
jgi:hypothetical protein